MQEKNPPKSEKKNMRERERKRERENFLCVKTMHRMRKGIANLCRMIEIRKAKNKGR